jgi:phosphoglucosamine mutase
MIRRYTVSKLFGTDGIRGRANVDPISPETLLRIGKAVAAIARRNGAAGRIVIAKDTRLSGYMIESALTAGAVSVGASPVLVGPMPTPALAMLTRSLRADLGIMITASHNPYPDNGIKVFGPDGYKLSDELTGEIERLVDGNLNDLAAPADAFGRARRLDDAQGRYVEYVKRTFPRGLRLDGLKIVLDCAHGAAYKVAPEILWELGAEVIPIGVEPNGVNINADVGATHTRTMRSQVLAHGADLGIALDGDADRIVVADEEGALVDGDQILGLIGERWHEAGRLSGGGVVATTMSNLGLERYLNRLGLVLVRTQVGDRHVVEHMRKNGFNLGGEPSGHIVVGDEATTGDGLVAALQVLAAIVQSDRPASRVCGVFTPVPQMLRNIPVNGTDVLTCDAVGEAIRDGERRLGDEGRLVVRKSGTEPLIRVMVEGIDADAVSRVIDDVVEAVRMAA